MANMSKVVTVAFVAERTGLRGITKSGGGTPGVADGADYSHGEVWFVFMSNGLHVIYSDWRYGCGGGGGKEVAESFDKKCVWVKGMVESVVNFSEFLLEVGDVRKGGAGGVDISSRNGGGRMNSMVKVAEYGVLYPL